MYVSARNNFHFFSSSLLLSSLRLRLSAVGKLSELSNSGQCVCAYVLERLCVCARLSDCNTFPWIVVRARLLTKPAWALSA